MYVLHGTWIPAEFAGFVQPGQFCLWAETAVTHTGPDRAAALPGDQLVRLLADELDLRAQDASLPESVQTRWLLLPHAGGRPLPSPELARALDLDRPAPDQPTALKAFTVPCHVLADVLGDLKRLRYLVTYQRDDLRLGSDLEFWYRVSRHLAQVIRKEQYLPALKCRQLPPDQQDDENEYEFRPGWEILSQDFEAALPELAGAMPPLCGAGAQQAHKTPALYRPEPLIRHFCECQLATRIYRSDLPERFRKRLCGTLLQRCYRPGEAYGRLDLDDYRRWRHWRESLAGHRDETLRLCFQLREPDRQDGDWWLDFQISQADDPSLRLSLSDLWRDPAAWQLARQRLGPDLERRLLLQLGQAARIHDPLWTALDRPHPTGLAIGLEEAFAFLQEQAWVLEAAGFTILVPAWWTPEGRRRAQLRLRVTDAKTTPAKESKGYFSLDTLVDYHYELSVGGASVSPEEWRQLVEAKAPLVRFRGQWLALEREQMNQLLHFWKEQGDRPATMPMGTLLARMAEGQEVDVSEHHDLSETLKALESPNRLQAVADPPGLQGKLRDYQKRGVAWLGFLENLGLNGCLADDMGLGKTLQVLARLLITGPTPAPTLLIAPTSVLGNWRREARHFAPELRVRVHHGSDRPGDPQALREACRNCDLLVTSYGLARRDGKLLQGMDWHRVVLDEAQNIKNPTAAQTKAILRLNSHHRLALTGTPVENRLLDLWSILNFLNPGYLGTQAKFRQRFEKPIQKDQDPQATGVLQRLAQPFILRRSKTDKAIIDDLPDKVENRQYCNLTQEQASLYQAVVREVDREIEDAEGMQRKGMMLATLLRLKQICNHPAQFLGDNSPFTPQRSHKLERLLEMLDEVLSEGDSALIFTQFTAVAGQLERALRTRCRTFYLHGGTPQERRERMVEEFQAGGAPSVFVLSLKAGGTGLTLTRASHVFHFDRWWNPAVEDQATDRAYRIGQQRKVFVHKFVTSGTLEERIDQMLEDKKAVAGAVVGSDESWLTELSNDEFRRLIRLSREAVMD